MKLSLRTALAVWVAALAAGAVVTTQGPPPTQPVSRGVSAFGATVADWTPRVDSMLRDGTLDIVNIQADTMMAGRTHERLGQRYEGVPVFGGQLIRQMDRTRVVSVFGRIFENVSVPTVQPTIDASDAATIAAQTLGARASAGSPELGILPNADRYVLVYRVQVRGDWDVRQVDVNAGTGAIEQSVSKIRQQGEPVIGRGTGVFGDARKMSVRKTSSRFESVDELRPAIEFTLDFKGSFSRLVNFLNTGLVVPSDYGFTFDNKWTDGALVDMHSYVGWTYDYYFKVHGRRGLDDSNTSVLAVVHPLARELFSSFDPEITGLFINNALYCQCEPDLILFGDGDGFRFDYFAAGLDVVAHELTHGVTSYTSDLEYHDESGALNEAISDIMATGAEFYFFKAGQQPQRGPNFLLGEDIRKSFPGYVRSMQNPNEVGDPDHYSLRKFIGTPTDNGGVHVNSTIVSHAFYLAVAGGTNRVSGIPVAGIGVANIERMNRIFYRAFSFLMGPLSQFSDARAATLQAAAELYGVGSNERAQLQQAWTAVGVN